jgi:eukaryotic-like serine/threonine-protein kinase
VLKTEISTAGTRTRVVAHFETPGGERVGEAVETVGGAAEVEQHSADLSARARDVLMRLWRDRTLRARAHDLARNTGAEEKLLAYYDLMGPSARAEFLDRGRALLDSALAADPRYVPALAERSMLLRLAAERPGDDPAADLRLARADADEALRLSPRDPQALMAECVTARRQMRDWPSDGELSLATSACSDAAQADPHSAEALYTLAFLHDQACDYGALIATLKLAIDRAARYDRRLLAPLRFYLVSVALQRRHLQEADAFSSDLIAQLTREEQEGKPAPLQGAHLLRAAVLMRLDRNAEAAREIEAELAHGASAIGGLDETMEAAALRGLSRIRHGAIGPTRAARLAALEQRFAAEDERSDKPSRVVGWFGFMDPEGAVAWMDAHKTQGGCELALHRARIYRDAGYPDRAGRALEACSAGENWAKRCARVISSDLASFGPPALR